MPVSLERQTVEFEEKPRDLLIALLPNYKDIKAMLDDKERRVAVEQWKNAPARFQKYKRGVARNEKTGKMLYEYPAGENLIINGEYVMSSCEQPWSEAAIDFGFRELTKYGKRGPFGVVEVGFGQGLAWQRAMRQLELYGGWYDGIELNEDVYERAKASEEDYNKGHAQMHSTFPGVYARPPIRIYHGDAVRALLTRARKIAEGKEEQADMILLDTYPIMEKDKGKGTHDLEFLSLVKLCIKDDSIGLYYIYHGGSPGGPTPQQEELIRRDFKTSGFITIPNAREGFPAPQYQINPAPNYPYLYRDGNPVRDLSIGWFRDPIR